MSRAEYVAAELEATVKHEYLRGEVFAMVGGTIEHGRLGARVIHLLSRELAGQPCSVLSSDVWVRVEATDLTTYPDASVVCGEVQTLPDDPHAVVNPAAVVEVLSDSTEAYDRGQKASHYRRIPTLRAYLLVSQRERRLELQVRRADGGWSLHEAGPGQRLTFEPLGVALAVDEVYGESLRSTAP